MRIVLASKSPRRKEILENLNIDFEIITADTDESSSITDGAELVKELSRRKAQAVYSVLENQKGTLVIGCDTVVCFEGEILGKPRDKSDAGRMLKMLSGKAHSVISGLTLIYNGNTYTDYEETKVYFDELSDSEIEEYILSGEPFDKAGAYGIQGLASKFIGRIEGCYFNVVGLPVNLLYRMIKKLK